MKKENENYYSLDEAEFPTGGPGKWDLWLSDLIEATAWEKTNNQAKKEEGQKQASTNAPT